MLDVNQIQSIAQSYSPQELFAALVWQRRFNQFDGQQVIHDLCVHQGLWASFLFTKPIFSPDEDGLSFGGLVDTLLAMANYRPMPETSIIHFIPYPADTLYLLTQNQDVTVSKLLDLGKKWQADVVEVCDASDQQLEWRLKKALWSPDFPNRTDAVIISYWWD